MYHPTTCTFNVIVSQSEPASCPNNTMVNAGFESNNTMQIPNWYVVGDPNLAIITNDAYSGSNAVQMVGTAYTKLQQDVSVVPGDELTFSAQVKATTNNYLVRLRFFNSNGNQISTYQGSESATGEYVENTLTATAPNNATYVSVTLVKLPNPGDIFADDFCLTISGDDPCTPDVQAPVITNCPEDIFINSYAPFGFANWPGPDVSDDCEEFPSLTSNYLSGSEFPLGTTTVIYTATDGFGNESTCSFDVVITQIDQPGSCENNMLNNPGFESNDTYFTSWASSGPAEFSISNDAYADNNAAQISGAPYGKIEQERYAISGVEYNLSAQIKSNTNNFYLRLKFLSASGQVISAYLSNQIVTGNYEEHSITATAPLGTESLLVSVLKTADPGDVLVDEICLSTDAVSECSPDVTPPVFVDDLPPAVLTYATSGTVAQANWSAPAVEDNCGAVDLTVSHTQDDFFPIGTTTVTYTATDEAGNTATYDFDIVVNFVVNPTGCEGNLITNSGYEDDFNDPLGWETEGNDNFFIINQPTVGNNFLQFSGTSAGGIKQTLPIQGGITYSLSAEILDFADLTYMDVKIFNANGELILYESANEPPSSDYELYTFFFDAPANSSTAEISVMRAEGIYQNIRVDNWCLKASETPDLTIDNVTIDQDEFVIARAGTIEVEVMNSSNSTIYADLLPISLELKLSELSGGAPNWTIGLVELEELEPGITVVDVPYYIQSDQGLAAGAAYLLIPKIDAYNVIQEQDESNNSSLSTVLVKANSGSLNCASHTFDSSYFLHCTNYLPNGNLQIVNNTQSGVGLRHEVNADGEVISSTNIGPLPGGPNSAVYYNIASGVLTKFNPYGGLVWTKTIPNDILNAYDSFEKVIEFDGGIVFTGYVNEGSDFPAEDKGLLVTKTDINLNVLTQEQFETPGNVFAFVHDLEVVDAQRLVVVYNEGTNYQGSNKATLMVLDESLSMLTSNVISERYGSVSVMPNISLLYTPCGYWIFQTYFGNAGGGGGFANINSESLGAYEFQNDEMVLIKRYSSTFESSGFGGTFSNTSSVNFVGPASDGTQLTASESISYGNGGPPPYVPIHSNDTLWMEQEDNGTVLWSAFKTPYLQYQFNELVEIGGNHFLLTSGNGFSIVPVDCDETEPPLGEPNCEASSAFPWHEWISNVTAGGLNNESGKSYYSDFTNLTPIIAEQGTSLDLSLTITFSYYTFNEYAHVWIDANQNDIFEESERSFVFLSAPPNGNLATRTWNANIGIPVEAELGLTKMRIIVNRDAVAEPCGEIPFGEVEDYYVNIIAGSSNLNSSNNKVEYDLKVFPNPAGDQVTIDLGDFLTENIEIEIVNNLGTSLYRKELTEVNVVHHKVDLSNWKNGVYMVWVKPEDKRRQLAKLVVARTY